MALSHSPKIVLNGLTLYLDAANRKSYPGSGTTWTDLSSQGNNGTLTNGVGYSGSNLGSLVFDGVDDFVNLNDSTSLTNTSALTINFWIKSNIFNSPYSSIIGKGTSDANEEYCVLMHSNFLYFDVGATSGPYTQPTYTFKTNTWYNICCVHSRTGGISNLPCYVNSIPINNSVIASTANVNDNSLPVSIGSRHYNSSTGPFNGNIAQVSIYNRALTALEIQQNFNALRGRFGI